ncbi:uncharacterized protein L969DRAFT_85244 [Mixia osmundae IAM 14324]|uniref:Mitochondrial fission 1 protein n=1 Tax=Mixia osmundae (strain CBS 9802 / IAM 14324 / JCM 22182 / KY 12970) TaxID=764103 RepID=G7DY95_MIXOS|nr:uncharacterized protein L969DRAFT_85244 [Mixia osmundae IAM 14324]KEI41458.1 hypothetical protein L969DRAFT_85244 [Mixia osmundae IAM 14324]GAA95555.1 hypothetical protein E5Q_02210 [Mixia osmundae IAM 14324]
MSLYLQSDAAQPLSSAELAVLADQFSKERDAGHLATQTKFNYAWGLVKSTETTDVSRGVELLGEIYRDEPQRRRECLFYLSVGHRKLGNYEHAKRFNDLLLAKEPGNMQAKSLATLIERDVQRDGYIGMAVGAGVAGLALAVFVQGIRSFSNRR